MIRSTMQDGPLTIGGIMRHGARVYGRSECVTWTGAGTRRASYATVAQNAGRLAGALARLGIGPGDPVATFCWNNQEHLEAYFGVPAMGAVLHTLNIRLPGAQVAQIVRHAGDRIIIVDDTLVPLLAAIRGPDTHRRGVHRQRPGRRVGAGVKARCRCCGTRTCWPSPLPARTPGTTGPNWTSGPRR